MKENSVGWQTLRGIPIDKYIIIVSSTLINSPFIVQLKGKRIFLHKHSEKKETATTIRRRWMTMSMSFAGNCKRCMSVFMHSPTCFNQYTNSCSFSASFQFQWLILKIAIYIFFLNVILPYILNHDRCKTYILLPCARVA